MKALDYDTWKLARFYVRKGEKATGRDKRTGKPTYTREQVEIASERPPREGEDEFPKLPLDSPNTDAIVPGAPKGTQEEP